MTAALSLFSRQLTLFHPPGIDTKKQCLECLAQWFERWNPRLKHQDVLEALHARERMGHTAITPHVAIPHARLPGLDAPIGVLMALEKSIPFDPEGHHPVSLAFALLVPADANEAHLNTLKQLATLLSDPTSTRALQQSHTAEELWTRFSDMMAVPTT